MKSRFLAYGSLALACILAAGGGAYLAVRNSTPASASSQVADQRPAPTPTPVSQGAPAGVVTTPPVAADTAPAAAPALPVREPDTASTAPSR